jgi:hypothetical protein
MTKLESGLVLEKFKKTRRGYKLLPTCRSGLRRLFFNSETGLILYRRVQDGKYLTKEMSNAQQIQRS